MYFTVAVLVLLVGTVVNAAPISHTIKMNVSDVEESPLPAFFFLEVRVERKEGKSIFVHVCSLGRAGQQSFVVAPRGLIFFFFSCFLFF